MGQRGPAKKPTKLNKLQGNPGRRPLNQREPQPSPLERKPTAPRWLSHAAKLQWKRLVTPLYECGLLTQVDQLALAMLCEAYATYQDARLLVEQEGMIAISEKGSPYLHPAVGIMNSSRRELLTWAREFGMTPSARTRIEIDADNEQAPSLADELAAKVNEMLKEARD